MSKSCGCVKCLGPGEYAVRITLRQYRCGAKKRGYGWNLTRTQALDLFARPCYYCNLPPSNLCSRSTGSFAYSGIERQDNSVGYEPDDCVPCCDTCNNAKGTMSEVAFRALASEARAASNSDLTGTLETVETKDAGKHFQRRIRRERKDETP
jgi:hypothetical protein